MIKHLHLLILGFAAMATSLLSAAESYLVMEAHSGRVLLAHNSEAKRPVASLTKIATAKVLLDWAEASNASLATLAVVPNSAMAPGGANPMGLAPGDRISLRDAAYSALLGSDNVAAMTIADHVGRALLAHRRRTGDPQEAFVAEMNQLAKALGMKRTRFANPHGLELPRQRAYSSAADIARLCVYAMRDTGFQFYVKQKTRQISVTKSDGRHLSYEVANTNTLLGKQGVNGIKTGLTTAAGQCLATNSHRSPVVTKLDATRSQIRKRDLIVVVLGSADRFGRTSQLIPQGWAAYDAWAAQGYIQSAHKREFIIVPKLP
ncbi:D-alanyl-D-alanine carboxypeptidase [Verrucomicrobiaceae bacterium R5-34]|nr:D-alanyl-D-alanine carboxypeptidase [Verrucomicrobiaceae bacterium R5-34]